MRYKQIIVSERGGPEVLKMVEQDLRDPAPGEVRVQVSAAGVSGSDVTWREGALPGLPKPPFVPGWDIAGVVDAVGDGVTTLEVGQAVAVLMPNGVGGYSEYAYREEQLTVPVPEGVDLVKAVAIILNYLTAYQMLHRVAQVKPGGSILIHGAAGGVGTAMLQLCRLAEINAYGTASKGKHDLVTELGGTPIDYRSEDFVARIKELASEGVDAVFDPIGGPMQIRRSFRALKPGGKVVGFSTMASMKEGNGPLTGPLTFVQIFLTSMLPNSKSGTFFAINPEKQPEWYREDLTKLLNLLAEGKIKPIIAERLPLTEAVRAHELLDSATVRGRVVLLNDG